MRIANRLLAFIVAVALIGVGVIVIIEVISARSHSGTVIINWHATLRWGQHHNWKSTVVVVASAILTAVGLLLLVLQLRRRRVARLRIQSGAATDAALTRKGVAVSIRGAVSDVDGIAGSRVKISHRRIRVFARSMASRAHTAEDLLGEVQKAASTQVESLHLSRERRLKVAVSKPKTGDE